MTVDAPERTPRRHERGRGRRPAPPAAVGWRFVYPVVLVALAVITLLLSATGARLVLDSRDGQVGRSEQDPTKPGYLETVPATPLLLVVHADADELYGAIVMALGDEDRGGAAIFLRPDLIVREGEDGRLDRIYEQHNVDSVAGDGLRPAISTLIGADIDATVTVDATSLASLVEPVAPLRFDVAAPVRVKGKTVLDDGEVALATADEIAAATEVIGTGEGAQDRLDRQTAFWSAWIRAVQADPERAFPSGGTEALARFMRGFAAEPPITTPLPTVVFDGALVPDAKTLRENIATFIPYPRQQGVRLNVALRNGVGDATLTEPMERRLVASGAQLASRGNADSFGVARTSVVYHRESDRDAAEDLAAAIGATDVRYEELVDSEIQVTVTIGSDFDPSEPTTTTS